MSDRSLLKNALKFARDRDLAINVIAGGSNVILPESLPGITLQIDTRGISYGPEEGKVVVAAGENWHSFVIDTIDHGLSGLENLSLIPGCVGAAPIQNIGAYGVEFANVFESLSALDIETGQWVTFDKSECRFSYRESIFRGSSKYIIASVTLLLDTVFHPKLDYPGVLEALKNEKVLLPTAKQVSEAICSVRREKLPDPLKLPNVGSFFKNPVISRDRFLMLRDQFPNLIGWEQPEGAVKISAAAVLEQMGLKGVSVGDAAVSTQHSLVIVNHGNATSTQVLDLAAKIQDEVREKCEVQLELEPTVLPLRWVFS